MTDRKNDQSDKETHVKGINIPFNVKINVLYFIILLFVSVRGIGQPYFDTQVANPFVSQNVFLTMEADTITPPVFETIKGQLPQPEWPARPDVLNCYWKTWEIAFSHLKAVPRESGFVSPFIEPAFNGNIFMWDCSFMTMFGKYAMNVFNFQQTLDNFYRKQHADGFICREIRQNTGTDCFQRFDISSTGPNILPWAEWEYYLNFNDSVRLAKVFPPLLAYYQWFQTYRSWPDGTYFSSGWGCGMDNQPRMLPKYNAEFSHGFMSWIDISLQQVMAGSILVEMAKKLNRSADVADIEIEIVKLKNLINAKMWDESKSYYFDLQQDGTMSTVKSIAGYWALIAGAVPENRVERFVAHLENPNEFARVHRVPTLSADHPDFNPDGGYWKGSVWAPTTYMVLRGLTKYKYDSLAYQIALNHVNNVVAVFTSKGTLYENYAPDKVQGNDRIDFVGWTGLVPITDLFEYVFGIRPDFPNNTLVIDVNLLDAYGVTKYPYGNAGLLDIHCKKRVKATDKPSISIKTNVPLKVIIKWQGNELSTEIGVGKSNL